MLDKVSECELPDPLSSTLAPFCQACRNPNLKYEHERTHARYNLHCVENCRCTAMCVQHDHKLGALSVWGVVKPWSFPWLDSI